MNWPAVVAASPMLWTLIATFAQFGRDALHVAVEEREIRAHGVVARARQVVGRAQRCPGRSRNSRRTARPAHRCQ